MQVTIRGYETRDREWLVAAHGTHYAREEGFDASFGTLVAEIIDAFGRDHDPTRERGWILAGPDSPLGCIFCVGADDGGRAKLRLFLLTDAARGRGLGRRLLDLCTRYARDRGYTGMVLWTHESHAAACALYARAGWRLQSSHPVTSFGVDLVEQHWSLDF